MIAEETALAAAKIVGASALGSMISQRFMPGMTWVQRTVSFISSMGLGCICGLAAAERFSMAPGSGMQLLVTASAAIFGLAIISNAMSQIPEFLEAIRKKFLGG